MKFNIIFVLSLMLVFSCQRKSQVIAKVGSESLTIEEFLDELKRAPDSYLEFIQSEHGRKHFLDVMVKEKIMISAAKEAKLDKSPEFRVAVDEFRKEQSKHLADYKKNLLIEKYYQSIKSDQLSVSDDEIQKFYDENREKYDNPVKITLSHIMLSDESKAQEVYERLQKGENFNRLVNEFSAQVWVNTETGKLEYTQPGSLSPELEQIALSLKVGEISKPVQSESGYFVLRKDSQIRQSPISIEDARQLIEMVLEKRKFDTLMNELANRHKIEYNKEALQKHFRQVLIDKAGGKK